MFATAAIFGVIRRLSALFLAAVCAFSKRGGSDLSPNDDMNFILGRRQSDCFSHLAYGWMTLMIND